MSSKSSTNNSRPNSGNFATEAATGGALALMSGLLSNAKQKWEGSHGQRAFSNVSASLPEGTQEYITAAKAKLFNLSYLRSPKVYFGIGEEKPFFVERDVPLLVSRMKHNFQFFYLNYILLTVVLFLLTLLISPGAIIGIGLLGFAWMAVIRATAEGSVNIKGINVSQKQATIAMSIFSFLVLFKILSGVFWWTLSTSGILVGAHSVLRDASMHKDEDDKVQMSGDLEDTAGLMEMEDMA